MTSSDTDKSLDLFLEIHNVAGLRLAPPSWSRVSHLWSTKLLILGPDKSSFAIRLVAAEREALELEPPPVPS